MPFEHSLLAKTEYKPFLVLASVADEHSWVRSLHLSFPYGLFGFLYGEDSTLLQVLDAIQSVCSLEMASSASSTNVAHPPSYGVAAEDV